MNRAELLAELRYVVADLVAPHAWSDLRLLHFLSEGQDKFCEQTGYWSDRSTYTITTILNQPDYTLSDRIIAVRSVWDGVSQLLDLSGGVSQRSTTSRDFFGESYGGAAYASGEYPANTLPSRPYRFRTDIETGVLTLLEPPIADVALKLRVHRRSKVALDDPTGQPEIPKQFHLALVEYGAYKAFGDHDRELQDPVKAQDHLNNFNWYVKDGKKAYRRLTGEYIDVVPNQLYVV